MDLLSRLMYQRDWGTLDPKEKARLRLLVWIIKEALRGPGEKKMDNELIVKELTEIKTDVKYLRQSMDKHLDSHANWSLRLTLCLIGSVVAILIAVVF